MILVIGSSVDKVYPTLLSTLREAGYPFSTIDEDQPERYAVHRESAYGRTTYRIEGTGTKNPVGAMFVRHAIVRTLDQTKISRMNLLQFQLNQMLLSTDCPVINKPTNAYSNYSKPYQIQLLAEANFDVPRSLVTNVPAEARRFYEECERQVIFKGVSNMLTLAQVLRPEHFRRFEFLPHCPTLFQEYVAGVDYRVHILHDQTFVTRLVSKDEDYRRGALIDGESIVTESATLPAEILEKCVAFTKQLGLVVSGIDFKESPGGRLVALECNPFPQFTFYERRSGQHITRAIVDYLGQHQVHESNVFA